MRIRLNDIVDRNLRSARQWVPRDANDTDADYRQQVERRIHVDPPDEDADHIEVTFDSSLVWAITDDEPDADRVLAWIGSAAPIGMAGAASPSSVVVNGKNVLQSAVDVLGAVLRTTMQEFAAGFDVIGLVDYPPERYRLTVHVQASLLTQDDDEHEHACLPVMWAELMGASSGQKGRYNVGLEDISLVTERFDVECHELLSRHMISRMRFRGVLKTNGGVVSDVTNIIRIGEVRFIFDRCRREEQGSGVQPLPQEGSGVDEPTLEDEAAGGPDNAATGETPKGAHHKAPGGKVIPPKHHEAPGD